MTDECPCCAPPWFFEVGTVSEFIYFGLAQFGSPNAHSILKVSTAGAQLALFYSGSGLGETMRALTVNPHTGYVYAGVYDRVMCFNRKGVKLWTEYHEAVNSLAGCLAVDNFGNVVSGDVYFSNYTLVSRNALTGVLNWVYVQSGVGNGFQCRNICVDKAGNTYIAGACRRNIGDSISGVNLISVDISGNERWAVRIPGEWVTPPLATAIGVNNYGCSSVAINDANDTLIVGKVSAATDNLGNPVPVEVLVDPATGSTISSLSIGAGLVGAGWDNNDNYYTSDSSNQRFRKNGTALASSSTINHLKSRLTFDISTENIYTCGQRAAGSPFFSLCGADPLGAALWGIDGGSGLIGVDAQYYRGTVGAFGKSR